MKTLVLTCLVAVSLGLFAGCSKSSSDSGTQQTPPPAQTPPPSATHTN